MSTPKLSPQSVRLNNRTMGQAFTELPTHSYLRVAFLIQTLLITLPCAIYCGIKLHRNWNEFFMKKRGTSLILLTFIVSGYLPLFEFPYYAVVSLIDPHVPYYTSYHAWITYPSMCCRLLGTSLFCARIYLLWFDHNHSNLMLSKGWAVLMDPEFGKNNQFFKFGDRFHYLNQSVYSMLGRFSYFITMFLTMYIHYVVRYKTTRGNSKWLTTRVVLPFTSFWLFLWALVHSYCLYDGKSSSAIASVQMLFAAVWLLVLAIIGLRYWCKFTPFMDSLGIREELKGVLWTLVLSMLSIAVISCIAELVDQWTNQLLYIVLMFILSWTNIVMFWLMMIFPELHWSGREGISLTPKSYSPSRSGSGKVPKLAFVISNSSRSRSNSTNTEYKSWTDIVPTMEGFQSFCNFLQKEFAAENLLFITEYTMIKQLLYEDETLRALLKAKDVKEISSNFKLPDKLEMSCIAKQYWAQRVFPLALWELYHKYVNPSAHLQINIDYRLSGQLQSIFAEYTEQDISVKMSTEEAVDTLVLLEQAAKQVAHLMNDCFYRFRRTPVYQELKNHLEAHSPRRTSGKGMFVGNLTLNGFQKSVGSWSKSSKKSEEPVVPSPSTSPRSVLS